MASLLGWGGSKISGFRDRAARKGRVGIYRYTQDVAVEGLIDWIRNGRGRQPRISGVGVIELRRRCGRRGGNGGMRG